MPRFPRTYGVLGTEGKLQPVGLILVERVVIQNFDIHLPLFEVLCFGNLDPRR